MDYHSTIAAIRGRSPMYVGDRRQFGLIHYLVGAYSVLLWLRPERIDTRLTATGVEIETDVEIPITANPDGKLLPFEDFDRAAHLIGQPSLIEGPVLLALSKYLSVRTRWQGETHHLDYLDGNRMSHVIEPTPSVGTRLSFAADPKFFDVLSLPDAILQSYLRRMSYLYSGTRFTLALGDRIDVFHQPGGLVDLFWSIAAPSQIMHEPIHVQAQENDLRLELVLGYQSWTNDVLCCFLNNGRVVGGGTHEAGLKHAIKIIRQRFAPNKTNGAVAVLSMHVPDLPWAVWTKDWIDDHRFRSQVREQVVREVTKKLESEPRIARQLQAMEQFIFPEIWSK